LEDEACWLITSIILQVLVSSSVKKVKHLIIFVQKRTKCVIISSEKNQVPHDFVRKNKVPHYLFRKQRSASLFLQKK